jgi:hypothetical protein
MSKRPAAQHAACGADNPSPSDLCADGIEQRIIRAYIRLVFLAGDADGSRTVTVIRQGRLEVRLTERPADTAAGGIPPFWLEVAPVAGHPSVDGCGFYQFDETELATAVDLVLEAAREADSRSSPSLQ